MWRFVKSFQRQVCIYCGVNVVERLWLCVAPPPPQNAVAIDKSIVDEHTQTRKRARLLHRACLVSKCCLLRGIKKRVWCGACCDALRIKRREAAGSARVVVVVVLAVVCVVCGGVCWHVRARAFCAYGRKRIKTQAIRAAPLGKKGGSYE
jgi:hypothetical protein